MDFFDYWFFKTNVNSKLKIKLIEKFRTTEEIFVNLIKNKHIDCVKSNEFDKFLKTYNILEKSFDLENYNKVLIKNDIKFIRIDSDNYPKKLKNIDNPPFAIFYKGDISVLNNYCISIVGTRNATPYGEEVCKNISKEISLNGVPIVSGGARGIDILSHKVCIENKGIPICVLGSGLLNYYPKENKSYFEEISKVGCILSEYDLHEVPDRYNFPARNRIISAIGDGLIVIEAKEKSGTGITVKYALDYGKDVAAVPGPIFWEKSSGCNKLIRDGAYMISEINDLYDIFKLNKNVVENNVFNYVNLCKDSKKYDIFRLIKSRPRNIDELVNETGFKMVDLYKILFELENLNIIEIFSDNLYHVKVV